MEVLTAREKEQAREAEKEERRLLKEIEDSFCVAGYEIIESNIFKESLRVYG